MSNQLQVSGAAKIRSIQGPVVANSGVITALDGDASQYVRGDGTLADFPTSTGGGSSVSYYLNSSVSQGTIGGVAYRQLSKVPISGAGTDITTSANGYIASYITDANDPALLEVPAGNFNCEFYFSVNSNSHNPYVYAELYKYDGTTFTLLGSNVAIPQYLTNGTTLSAYYFAIPVATSVLTVTDRISIRIYVNVDGRTVTLHTENNHLCQVVTTFSNGLISLNNLTRQNQFFQTGTSGTDFAISSATATHTFNLPVASASNTGKLSSTDWSTFNNKLSTATAAATYVPYTGATTNVDLGDYSIKVNGILAYGASGSGGLIAFRQTGTLAGAATGSAYIGSVSAGKLNIYFGDAGLEAAILDNSLLTADRTYNFPNASGTLALTSNLSSYVPYTGATADVDLGIYGLSANLVAPKQIILKKDTILGGAISIETGSGFAWGGSNDTILLASGASNTLSLRSIVSSVLRTAILDFSTITASSSRTFTLPDASGTLALLSANQTFTGLNTFSSVANMTATLQVQQGLLLNQGIQASALAPYTAISGYANGLFICPNSGTGYYLVFPTSSSYVYTFPAATGTLALTSNLSSYVPYTGATTNVNLGVNDFTSRYVNSQFAFIQGDGTMGGVLGFTQYATSYTSTSNNTNIYALGNNKINFSFYQIGGAFKIFNFDVSSLDTTNTRAYTLPNASGTLALTSDIPSLANYVTLTTTQTISGAKTFTSDLNAAKVAIANSNTLYTTTGYTTLSASNVGTTSWIAYVWGNVGGAAAILSFDNTAQYTYTFPATGGTIALTSNLSSYLPLTGGTLTGQLYINPTNTGTVGLDVASNTTRFRSDNLEGFKRQLEITMGSGTLVQCVAKGFGGTYGTDLAFYTSSASGVNGSPAMYITGGNKIGLGIGSPAYTLDIVGTLGVSSTSYFAGNVGIGTSSPSHLLTISSGNGTFAKFGSNGYLSQFNNGAYIIGGAEFSSTAEWIARSTSAASIAVNETNSGAIVFLTNTSLTSGSGFSPSERMRITSAGNVGIGTSSPTVISGFTSVCVNNATSGGFFEAQQNGTVLSRYGSQNDISFIDTVANIPFIIKTNSTERMRITSAGKGLFGTTTPSAGAGGFGTTSFQVNNEVVSLGSTAGIFWENRSGGVTTSSNWYGWYTTGGTIFLYNGAANAASINPSTGAYVPLSDINKKKDFESSTIGLNAILGLKPTLYRIKTDDTESDKELGFIAQEVKDFIPQAYVEQGEGEDKFIGLNYNAIVAALVKSVQELKAEIQELKNK